MREHSKSQFTFRVANRAYFKKSLKLNSCLQKVLSNELRVTDMSKVSFMCVRRFEGQRSAVDYL